MSTPTARFVPDHKLPATPDPEATLILARALDVVVRAEGDAGVRFPTLDEASLHADTLLLLGRLDGREVYAAPLAEDASLPEGLVLAPARTLFERVDEVVFALGGRAIAVVEADVNHRFCGKCGRPTRRTETEPSRECTHCDVRFYARIAPAVIVLVRREGKALLARNATFPRPWFSCLAGFVEPGESLEECAAREVREESGVEVGALQYFGSQPWPYGRSLMVGFFAEWAGGEVAVDGAEIAEARWFAPDEVPGVPPKLSIARKMIDAWREGRDRTG